MNTLIVGIAGYSRTGAQLALRDSCVGCSLLIGLLLIGIAAYQLYRAPSPEHNLDH